MEVCIGRMQMTLTQFWDSEPREIIIAINGWRKQKEEEMKAMAEQLRLISFYAIVPHIKSGTINKPADLYALAWDAPDKSAIKVTPEEFKRITAKWDAEQIGPDGKFR